jgi:hypothetical protein
MWKRQLVLGHAIETRRAIFASQMGRQSRGWGFFGPNMQWIRLLLRLFSVLELIGPEIKVRVSSAKVVGVNT